MNSIYVNNSPSSKKIVSAKGNQVTVNFNPPIQLDHKKKYQLRCLEANIVYCMPNVFTGENNKLYYYLNTSGDASSMRTITFEAGLYSLKDINRTISIFTSDPNNGNDSKLIVFSADPATSKIYVSFNQARTAISLSFAANIMYMLGFAVSQADVDLSIGNKPIKTIIKSANPAQLNSLTNILIKCDIVTGSYQNSQLSNVIASVTPDVLPYSNIAYRPYHTQRLAVNVDNIEQMTITLVDQNGQDIDLGTNNGVNAPELWSVTLSIEPVEMARIL